MYTKLAISVYPSQRRLLAVVVRREFRARKAPSKKMKDFHINLLVFGAVCDIIVGVQDIKKLSRKRSANRVERHGGTGDIRDVSEGIGKLFQRIARRLECKSAGVMLWGMPSLLMVLEVDNHD